MKMDIRLVILVLTTIANCQSKDFSTSWRSSQPNIVFILTDDQDTVLGGLTPMDKVRKLLKEQGTEFVNMFTSTPICCPSRTSILTGRYQHNHQTMNNSISGNCSSSSWQKTLEKETVATFAKSLGYETFFAGKYLNQYGKKRAGGPGHIPPGWDHWLGLVGNSRYYNYSVSDNGQRVFHGQDYHEDYFTDLIANRSSKFIHKMKDKFDVSPFFMMISTPAPHSPWNAAPQYSTNFTNNTAPKTGSYNKRGTNHHWLIRQAAIPMSQISVDYADNAFRSRWRTLLSVDDLVEKVVNALDHTGFLDNTFIIYSSDNGYHLGQFGLPIDKRQLYEFDLRVPLIVRGPGVPKNITRDEPVLNIDIAPTILDIANGSSGNFPQEMDGRSFRPFLQPQPANTNWRQDFLVEYQGEGSVVPPSCPKKGFGVSNCFPDCVCEDAYNNTYSCVRTFGKVEQLMYCEFTDSETFVSLYNLTSDPDQMKNIRDTVDPKMLVKMNTRLIELGLCSSSKCREAGRYGSYANHGKSKEEKEIFGERGKQVQEKITGNERKKVTQDGFEKFLYNIGLEIL